MGKRSDFEKIPKDKYYTWDARAYVPVRSIFRKIGTFIEPCAGAGDMIRQLEKIGPRCTYACDVEPTGEFERIVDHGYEEIGTAIFKHADYIITNPPWTRSVMHPFIEWCIASGLPAWLLIDTNWASSKQARPFLAYCSDIVPTPRLKWIPDSKDSAKDDTAWYRFQGTPCDTIWRNSESRTDRRAKGLLE
jgi:hypothetical protein